MRYRTSPAAEDGGQSVVVPLVDVDRRMDEVQRRVAPVCTCAFEGHDGDEATRVRGYPDGSA